jgi:choline-sulfatase
MVCSLINPHDICFPVLEKLYSDKTDYGADLPPNYTPQECPDIKTVASFTEIKLVESMQPSGDDRAAWREYINFYCKMIKDVDTNMGIVLDALERSGQWDNTVVVFTSDHGEMGASHGMLNKGPTMYEENIRIPFWISDPRNISGTRQDNSLVSNLDLLPTLCEIGGVTWPTELAGLDLTPLLTREGELERDAVFAEGSPRPTAVWRGVRTHEWKYWHYTNGEEVLFNLENDPLEMDNLAGNELYKDVLSKFRAKVRKWRLDTHDPVDGFM